MKFEDVYGRCYRGDLSQIEASEILGVSERTFRRWRDRYEADGAEGLYDRRLGRVSARRAPVDTVARVLELFETRYWDFTAKHFHEQLVAEHGFGLSYNWLRLTLQAHGRVRPAARRGAHRRKRPRRPMAGMMLHQDGSSHEWVPGQAQAGGGVDKDNPTQLGRALNQLGIELIPAYSPEARGRSERLFGTLQKRLPQELRRAGIATMEDANRYLKEVFWPAHNARFARPAEDTGSAFVAFAGTLEDSLCAQQERVVAGDNTLRYKGRTLQIPADRHRHHYVKARVRVHEYPDTHLAIFHGPRCLARYRADGSAMETTKRQAA